MRRRELSGSEFHATFAGAIRDVSSDAEELVDLRADLDPLLGERYSAEVAAAWNWRVAFIYESADSRFQRIGVPVPKDNTYLVVVVEVPSKSIFGHHLLDLGEQYDLAARATQLCVATEAGDVVRFNQPPRPGAAEHGDGPQDERRSFDRTVSHLSQCGRAPT